jgi:hypothetical protein
MAIPRCAAGFGLAVCPSADRRAIAATPLRHGVYESVRYSAAAASSTSPGGSRTAESARAVRPALARELDLAGLILIRVAPNGGTGGLPTLIIKGARR